jgi:signal transduction histidine kinase
MKLRTQFFILVGGIIAVPLVVSAFMLVEQSAIQRSREPFSNYGQINSWMRREVPSAVRSHEIVSLMRMRPPGLDVIVLDKNDLVSLSTVPELTTGTPAMGQVFMSYIRANIDRYHFQVETFRGTGDDDSLILLKVPRMKPEEQRFRNLAFSLVMYPSIALMIFSSVMSFLILRSLNRSILTLEGATRRVAEGDLDFDMPARGNDRIASLTRSFDSMRRALKEEYARRARFIMGVSHDLRTPLTLIQGYVEAISDGYAAEPEAQKRYLSIILDKTRGLEGMVGELIEFVRMETGQWRMTHRDVAIRQFLMEMARRFAEDALILRRDFGWSIDVPEDVTVRMDAGLVTRALENLVGNAIRYTEENGKISLSARMEEGKVQLSIADTGVGIATEDLSRIFDPFYRGTNSRREAGFGLGLTTVKSIIESHGWTIGVFSQVDMGSTFTIRMPVTPKGTA